MATTMPYSSNYGNPWSINNFGQTQGQNVLPNNNQNPAFYNNQIPQQNYGSFMTVLVQGEAGANAYPVASGNTVMLMDFESGKFWLKSNVNGIPQRLRSFSFAEELPEQSRRKEQMSSTISREEFDGLSSSVAKLSECVNKLIADLGGSSNE